MAWLNHSGQTRGEIWRNGADLARKEVTDQGGGRERER